MSTVIIGAGIIGVSTAYYLSQSPTTDPSSIYLIESSPELFASASGYAAGFLARDWFSAPVASLGALSFDLHKQLAEEHNGREKWGYSQSIGTSLLDTDGTRGEAWFREGGSRAEAAGKHEFYSDDGPAWLTRREGEKLEIISQGDSTAQVDPLRLCHFLLSACLARGIHLHQPAHAHSLTKTPTNTLQTIKITTTTSPPKTNTIPCTRLILAAGAWTPSVHKTLFPSSKLHIPISPLAGHSLLLRSPHYTPPSFSSPHPSTTHAVFTTDPAAGYSPELFSRNTGHIYLAGLNSPSTSLPPLATARHIDPQAIAKLKRTAERLMGPGLEIVREGLCFRPVFERGACVLGPLAGEGEGVWVAGGHGPWGICLSLGTGVCVAEMVEGRECSAEVGGLGL
ncbi:hypothetical protein MMC12_002962 [Toensbergia leucococca]|nr:hypothetical protein [Toensbergia leucococca]